jgi:hypothetical protein
VGTRLGFVAEDETSGRLGFIKRHVSADNAAAKIKVGNRDAIGEVRILRTSVHRGRPVERPQTHESGPRARVRPFAFNRWRVHVQMIVALTGDGEEWPTARARSAHNEVAHVGKQSGRRGLQSSVRRRSSSSATIAIARYEPLSL